MSQAEIEASIEEIKELLMRQYDKDMRWSFWHGVTMATLVILALWLTFAPSKACAQTIGLHAATWHDSGHLESKTPGAYIRLDNGFTAGAYRNSYRLNSAYAGYTMSTPHAWGDWSLTVGIVTGYPAGTLPLLAPSTRIGPIRLTLIPKAHKSQTATGIHLSAEIAR